MLTIYNSPRKQDQFLKILGNWRVRARAIFAILIVFGSISCREAGPQTASQAPAAAVIPAKEAISRADELYRQRADFSKVRDALELLRQARAEEFGNYEVNWKLAKFNYYLGDHTDNDQERDAAFREGTAAGKAAVQISGDRPEGHFWLGANYGGSAEHSTLSGLSNFEDIQQEMEAVLKIDEGFQSGSAYLALGRLYLKSPRLLGGDTQKAIEYLEKGLQFGKDNAPLRSTLAEAYLAANRTADARKQLDALSAMTPHPDYIPEHEEALADGKRLREKMDAR